MPPSLRQIGEIAKVSNVTVMRALRDDPRVRPELKKKIQRIADSVRYEPNLLAKGLLEGRTATVAILVPRVDATSLGRVIQGATTALRENDYRAILLDSEDDTAREYEEIRQAAMRRVDGMLMVGAKDFVEAGHVDELRKRNIPIVLMTRPVRNVEAHVFTGMDEAAGHELTQCLLERGHRRIGHVAPPNPEEPSTQRRTAGWRRALREWGLEPEGMPIVRGWWTDVAVVTEAVQRWLQEDDPPTAIYAATEIQAAGVYHAAYREGVRIGEDLSVVSFITSGDFGISKYLVPTLAGLVQPGYDIGYAAAECLLREIRHDDGDGEAASYGVHELPFRWQDGGSLQPSTSGNVRKEG